MIVRGECGEGAERAGWAPWWAIELGFGGGLLRSVVVEQREENEFLRHRVRTATKALVLIRVGVGARAFVELPT
jgi:hypothetical protein